MKHKKAECDCDGYAGPCNLCNLFICEICGAAEGELTTDCPGYKLSYTFKKLIWRGKLDYKDGEWRVK